MAERAKAFIKSTFPAGVLLYRRIRTVGHSLKTSTLGIEKVFSDIYRKNSWADPESVSGRGSTLAHTEVIRRELPNLLESVGANSILDAACGDFNWMRHTDLRGVEYSGVDIVPELIARNRSMYAESERNFVVLDITGDELTKADVILCRDCFIHLSFEHARAAITNFKRSGSMFLLATTHTTVRENTDVVSGGWRSVNLQLPPYDFPEPLRVIVEDPELGKTLGMWQLADL
ncbi:MAG TPA: class I SAM-dependent methyltransferase [Pyrinomonadaceae bacterium]|nr:class I SAM-dependent methyltransferase [Pyrinomonadaceae bacterium]